MRKEGAVPAQFVESNAPIGRDADRIQGVDLRSREGTGPTTTAKFHQGRKQITCPWICYGHFGYFAVIDILGLHDRLRFTASTARQIYPRRTCVASSAVGYGYSGHKPVLDYFRKRVEHVVDATGRPNKPGVDDGAFRWWRSESTMVHLDRKVRVAKVAIRSGHWEAEILDEPKETVDVIVCVDSGKLVGADIPDVEVAARRARRRLEVWGGHVGHFCKGPFQRLRSGVSIQTRKLFEFSIWVEHLVAPVGRVG